MDRRLFLKLTGLVAAASALEVLPVAAAGRPDAVLAERAFDRERPSFAAVPRLSIREPGTYQISGLVRIEEPLVEISGITNAQRISWSDTAGSEPRLASFTTFERFDGPGMTPDIRVRGGRLETLAVVPMDLE